MDVQLRTLGRTGEKVSCIGMGGFHLGRPNISSGEAVRLIRQALDRGLNFLDNSWDYNEGQSETRMGIALRDGYRQKAFLMTKFDGRTKESASSQIDESLARLQTDHVDVLQLHEVIRFDDADRFFAEGGAAEALMAAKKEGKTRYIGFTGHKDPLVHLRMLDVAAQRSFHFDSCQMPLNVLDYHFRSFSHNVVPRLVKEGIAVLGMKPMAFGNVLKAGVATPIECLHYALNLPTSVVITGCDSMERLEQAFEAARTFKPFTQSELAALVAKTREVAMSGNYEPFKTTAEFDGTATHPEWMV
jgi:aryl-alcohol dehydrogenase-like predicted oxidoreductase